jgi:hypothetical protein
VGIGERERERDKYERSERRGSVSSGGSSGGGGGGSGAAPSGSSSSSYAGLHRTSSRDDPSPPLPSFLPSAAPTKPRRPHPPHQHQHPHSHNSDTAPSSSTTTTTTASSSSSAHVPSRRYPLNPHMVSDRAPDAIFQQLQHVLRAEGIVFSPAPQSQGLCVQCVFEDLLFEAEVLKIPRLNMHGVHFRRVRGDAAQYQHMCTVLIACMQL